MSERFGSADTQRQRIVIRHRRHVQNSGLRIDRAARPVRAAGVVRQQKRRQLSIGIADDGRRIQRSHLVLRRDLDGLRFERRA